MAKKLKQLNDHNEIASKLWSNENEGIPRLNGIACPICRKELYDTKPNFCLLSHPPKKNINCNSCGYTGYRIVKIIR